MQRSIHKRPGAKRLGPGGFACPCCAPQRDREARNQMKRAANKRSRQMNLLIAQEQFDAGTPFLSDKELAFIHNRHHAIMRSHLINPYSEHAVNIRVETQVLLDYHAGIADHGLIAATEKWERLINQESLDRYYEDDSYDPNWDCPDDGWNDPYYDSPNGIAFRSVWGPAEQDEVNPDDTMWRYYNSGGWEVLHLRWDADEQKFFAYSTDPLRPDIMVYDHTHTPEQIQTALTMSLRMEGIE